VNAAPSWPHGTVIGVRAGRADVAGTRAQQNVIVGCFIDVFLEGADMRISGNKLNVLPDGLHDIDVTATGYGIEAIIETGRENNNMVVGTDGDGLNDAEERNVFGGVSIAGDGNIIEIYGNNGSDTTAANTNIIIAGNYFGVAVDGVTRFTNSMTIVDAFHNQNGVNASVQFGSDFNGVSDAIEGNLIYMNNPFTTIFPDPSSSPPPPSLFNADAGARVSVRGNTMVNNGLVPFSYADGSGGRLANFTNYEAPFFETASPIIPVLLTKSSSRHLLGVAAKAVGIHTNVFIDVYLEDLEGWTNGMKFGLSELVAGGVTNGFPQGKTFKGSFSLGNNFPGGNFDLDITSLGLSPGAFVTAAANYSADPPGTARGRAHTSNFPNPVTLLAPIVITSATKTGNTVTLNWTGGAAPYTLQKRSPITGAWGNVATGIGGTSASDTSATGSEAYYRVLN